MKEIRTTFYDLRGYFIPGSLFLWAILELLSLTGYETSTEVLLSLTPAMRGIFFIVLSYVVGHGLHAVANFTIDKFSFASYPPKDYFDGEFQRHFSTETINELFESVTAIQGIQGTPPSSAIEMIKKSYWVCFQYVMHSGNIETENFLGLNGFYRGTTSALLVSGVTYIIAYFFYCKCILLCIGIAALSGALLFLTRVKRFNYYLAKTVYSNFLHIYNKPSSTTP